MTTATMTPMMTLLLRTIRATMATMTAAVTAVMMTAMMTGEGMKRCVGVSLLYSDFSYQRTISKALWLILVPPLALQLAVNTDGPGHYLASKMSFHHQGDLTSWLAKVAPVCLFYLAFVCWPTWSKRCQQTVWKKDDPFCVGLLFVCLFSCCLVHQQQQQPPEKGRVQPSRCLLHAWEGEAIRHVWIITLMSLPPIFL